ncbi:MAG: hypothetical protein A4E73_02453 [Syntrophaceae bacterium PtaU1.Bin231]|jgi:hypothetical protein|nr:MAG: hypothetical protein A4E73_02453 [Syntrophaceae bacterium PtaU1.Bin231]
MKNGINDTPNYGEVLRNVAEIEPVVTEPGHAGCVARIEDRAYEALAKVFHLTDGRKSLSFCGFLNRRYYYEKVESGRR